MKRQAKEVLLDAIRFGERLESTASRRKHSEKWIEKREREYVNRLYEEIKYQLIDRSEDDQI